MPVPLRTLLFAPGNDARKAGRALAAPVSAACLDLEDAVAPSQKVAARAAVVEAIAAAPAEARVAVRVNGAASGLLDDDLDALAPALPRLDLVVVPMVDGPDVVRHVAARLDGLERAAGATPGRIRLLAVTETAAGILAAPAIAAADERLETLVFGPADLALELGVELTADGEELRHARSAVVLAARAAGRTAPVDGPHVDVADDEGCRINTRWSRRLGFQGKLVIHPRQIAIVDEVFLPGAAELEQARAVVEAYDAALADGVASIRMPDGRFVDAPIADRARALLAAHAGPAAR